MDQNVDFLERALLLIDRAGSRKIFFDSANSDPMKKIEELIIPVLENIGAGWENGSVALSQVYMSGLICEELVDEILPQESQFRKNQPKTAIAVLEDYHMLGKRIVYSILRASGFEIFDYGRMQVDELVKHVIKDGIEVLLISTLMLSSALRVISLREKLNSAGKNNVKIIVGGAPFRIDDKLWNDVGADAMGASASDARNIVSGYTGGVK